MVLPVSADQAEFDGTWSYVSAICGQSLSSEQLVAALSTPAGPIRGELQISSQAQQFTAMERDGGLCGVAVPPQIEPTRRCEADVFTSTGRFRLKPETGLQRAGPGRAGQSGLASFESWVPVSQTADQGRQGLGTSRIEHAFELFDVQVGTTRHRLLKIVTMPGEIFTDACIDAGLGRFTLYLLKKPSV